MKKIIKISFMFHVSCLMFFLFSSVVFAQYSIPNLPSLPSSSGMNLDQFSGLLNNNFFEVSRFSPLVGNDFKIKIRSSGSFEPSLSEIFWYVDGNIKAAGVGKDTFSFQPEQWGKNYEIKAIAKTPNNNIIQNTHKFTLGDLNLTWLAQTSTPKDYQGLALATPGSLVKVSAQPMMPLLVTETVKKKKITKTKQENAGKLFYRWFLDDKIQQASSGVGKSEFSFVSSLLSDTEHIATVEVEDIKKTQALRQFVKIKVVRPKILLSKVAEKASLVGDNLLLKSGETVDFIAQPYFFDSANLNDLDFNWSFNGKKIPGDPGSDPNRLTLSIPEKGRFTYNQLLSLAVAGKQNIFQRFIKNISIKIQ